ncbi:hypothetical protein D1007_39531 [Hordeum vulgare]|nr:hypothetical protein D1007_39531 [Hordeum vulgare]
MEQDVALNDTSRDPTSSSIVTHFFLMAKVSKVSPTLNPNISHDDDVDDNGDEDNDEESDDIASLKIKGEMIFKSLYKNKLACSNFLEIMSIATEGKKYIEELEAHIQEHEATNETMEGHERDYANEIAELSQALQNEQTTKESLEETFALELSRLKESHDMALEVANDFRTKNDKLKVAHAKLLEGYDHLENGSGAIKSSLIELTESHAQLKASYAKELANACVDTNHVEESEELKAQVTSLKKYLEKSHEGMSTLNNVLCGQKSPDDKDGLGFNSNVQKLQEEGPRTSQEFGQDYLLQVQN